MEDRGSGFLVTASLSEDWVMLRQNSGRRERRGMGTRQKERLRLVESFFFDGGVGHEKDEKVKNRAWRWVDTTDGGEDG